MRCGKPEEVVEALIRQLGSVSAVAFHEEVGQIASFLVFNHSYHVIPNLTHLRLILSYDLSCTIGST